MAFRRVMGCQQGRIPVFFVYPVDIYYMKVLDIVRIRAVDVEGARLTAWEMVSVEDLTSGQHKRLDFTLPDAEPTVPPACNPLVTCCNPLNDPFGYCTEIPVTQPPQPPVTKPPAIPVKRYCKELWCFAGFSGCVKCPIVDDEECKGYFENWKDPCFGMLEILYVHCT